MKRYIYQIVCLIAISLAAYSQDYYWYRGQKLPLEYGNRQYILYQDNLLSESDKAKIEYSESVDFAGVPDMKYGLTKPDAVIEDMEHVLYKTQSYKVEHDRDVFVTHYFYVQLKEMNDYAVLLDMANQYHAKIEKEGDFALWYILRWDLKCQYNALELANIFYESELFAETEPEFMNANAFPGHSSTTNIKSDWSSETKKKLHDGSLLIECKGKMFDVQGLRID
ncbi:MAG: hypothetical protein IJQ97_04470 [Paludibacteraceae bacterium]|nr:hypothetical protein [Paludibacteraceae bacterium]